LFVRVIAVPELLATTAVLFDAKSSTLVFVMLVKGDVGFVKFAVYTAAFTKRKLVSWPLK
jgi:hypothetical protein